MILDIRKRFNTVVLARYVVRWRAAPVHTENVGNGMGHSVASSNAHKGVAAGALVLIGLSAIIGAQRLGRAEHAPSAQTFGAACSANWLVRPLWETASNPSPEYPLERPSGVRVGSTFLLAGNVKAADHSTPQGDSLIIVGLDGRRIKPPEAARAGVQPVLGATADTLYLIWGEARNNPTTEGERWPPAVSAVWVASKIGESPWSVPREIVRAKLWVEWGPDHTSRLIRASDGALEFAFIASHSASNASLVLTRLLNGVAVVHERQLDGSASFARMARRNDTAFVVVVKADQARHRDQNSLFFTRWNSGNSTWSPLEVVQHGNDQGVLYPQVALTPDGLIHLAWTQSRSDGLRAEVLRHVASRDGGVTWSAPTDLLQAGAWPQDALSVGNGTVAVVYLEHDWTDGPRLVVACWRSGWQKPRSLVSNDRLFDYVLLESDPPTFIATRRHSDAKRFENVLVRTP